MVYSHFFKKIGKIGSYLSQQQSIKKRGGGALNRYSCILGFVRIENKSGILKKKILSLYRNNLQLMWIDLQMHHLIRHVVEHLYNRGEPGRRRYETMMLALRM